MFQTLGEQIETTEAARARLAPFASVAAILVVLFAALYYAIVSFE
jgi:hypothetical protein